MTDFLVHLAYFVSGVLVGALSQQICGKQIQSWFKGIKSKIGNAIASDGVHPTDPPKP